LIKTMMMWPLPDDGWFSNGTRRPHRPDDPDVRLTHEVADALLADERTRRQRITVEVQNRVVLLSGVVDCPQTREVATAVVRHVPEVRDVCNGLRPQAGHTAVAGSAALLTTERSESDTFDEIATELRAPKPLSDEPARRTRRLPGLVLVVIVAVISLLFGVLLAILGWPILLIGCMVGMVIAQMVFPRRRPTRGRRASWPSGD
jgi:hypothetical protein